LNIRHLVFALLAGHLLTIHQDRKLTTGAIHNLYIVPGVLPQFIRHPGGMLLNAASNRAASNRYLSHGPTSFVVW